MKIPISRIALMAAVVALVAGCASAPAPGHHLRNIALITSGDIVSYSATGSTAGVSVVDVDGKPVSEPYGPIELAPGSHSVTMKCNDTVKTHKMTVAAGEVYQFNKVTTPGVKGCVGALSRVRSTNP